MDAYETHQPTLRRYLGLAGDGPVLELGVGHGSTPLLHELCAASGRRLVSLDSDPVWVEQFAVLASPDHEIRAVESWDDLSLYQREKWALAFVDNAPGSARTIAVHALRDHADLIVVHDTEPAVGPMYYQGLADALACFKFSNTFGPEPLTTVVSMTRAV